MKTCPKCHSLTDENLYFGTESCTNINCNWSDNTIHRMRVMRNKILSDPDLFRKYENLIKSIIKYE